MLQPSFGSLVINNTHHYVSVFAKPDGQGLVAPQKRDGSVWQVVNTRDSAETPVENSPEWHHHSPNGAIWYHRIAENVPAVEKLEDLVARSRAEFPSFIEAEVNQVKGNMAQLKNKPIYQQLTQGLNALATENPQWFEYDLVPQPDSWYLYKPNPFSTSERRTDFFDINVASLRFAPVAEPVV